MANRQQGSSSAGGWEIISKKKKSASEKRADKQQAALANVDPDQVRRDALYNDFLREDDVREGPRKNPNKPNKQNGSLTGAQVQNNAQNKVNKNKQSKSKLNVIKVSKPASIEQAVSEVSAREIRDIINGAVTLMPTQPFIWLSNVAIYLNSKLPFNIKDLIYSSSSKPFDFPFSVLKNDVKEELFKLFARCRKDSLREFQRLTVEHTIPEALNRQIEHSLLGYMVLVQCLAIYQKSVAGENLERLSKIRSKEQVRSLIYLAQTWCLSRAGYLDLHQGLIIWRHLFLPVLNTKAFATASFAYLQDIIKFHPKAKLGGETLEAKDILFFLNVIFSDFAHNNHIHQKLIELYPKVKSLAFDGVASNVVIKFFTELLPSLTAQMHPQVKKEVLSYLCACLRREPKCFIIWEELYQKNFTQSNLLINHISANFDQLEISQKQLRGLLNSFQTVNDRLQATGKLDLDQIQTTSNSKVLLNQMSNSGNCGCRLLFWLLIGLTIFVFYDVNRYGSLARSKTGRVLQDIGVFRHVQVLLVKSRPYTDPITNSYRQHVGPTVDPYIQSGTQNFVKFVDSSYNKIEFNTRDFRKNFGPFVAYYANLAYKQLEVVFAYYNKVFAFTVQWFQKNVFVGQLSPENLKVVLTDVSEKINQVYLDAYQWASKQVANFVN